LRKSFIYASISILFWATTASAFKITLKYLDFVNVLFYSNIIALIVFFIINFRNGNFKNLNLRENVKSIYFGFFVPFLYYIFLFLGYSILKGQEMLILNNTWQIFLSILSAIFILKRIKLNEVIGIFLSFFGIIFLASKGNLFALNIIEPYKIFIGITCALIWAFYWLLSTTDNRKIEVRLFYNFLFGFVYICAFLIIFGKFKFNLYGFLGSVYIGLFEMSITYLIYAKALSYKEDIPKISNFMYLAPLISLMLLSIIVKEKIEIYTIISAIFIILGIFINSRK